MLQFPQHFYRLWISVQSNQLQTPVVLRQLKQMILRSAFKFLLLDKYCFPEEFFFKIVKALLKINCTQVKEQLCDYKLKNRSSQIINFLCLLSFAYQVIFTLYFVN